MKRTEGASKKGQSREEAGGSIDVDMNEEFASGSQEEQQHTGEQWSLYCTLSPLAEGLLQNPVSACMIHCCGH